MEVQMQQICIALKDNFESDSFIKDRIDTKPVWSVRDMTDSEKEN